MGRTGWLYNYLFCRKHLHSGSALGTTGYFGLRSIMEYCQGSAVIIEQLTEGCRGIEGMISNHGEMRNARLVLS